MVLKLIFSKDPDPAREKRTGRAAILGILMPFVAYAYVGRFRRGLVAVALALLFVWAMSHLPFGLLDYRPIALVAGVSHWLAAVGLCFDAGLLVRRRQDRTGLWYQGFTFYIPLFAAWVAFDVASHRLNATTLFKAIQVCGESWGMQPAIRPKDCVLVAPSSRWQRGDIVFYQREGATRFGRVVGLSGDMVEMRGGAPLVNGAPFAQQAAPRPPLDATSFWGEAIVALDEVNTDGRSYVILRNPPAAQNDKDTIAARRIPDGHLFVLADFRDRTGDSRWFGDLPLSDALGKPIMVSRSPDWSRFGELVR